MNSIAIAVSKDVRTEPLTACRELLAQFLPIRLARQVSVEPSPLKRREIKRQGVPLLTFQEARVEPSRLGFMNARRFLIDAMRKLLIEPWVGAPRKMVQLGRA